MEIACDFSLAKPKIRTKPWNVVWQNLLIALHEGSPADRTARCLAQTDPSAGARGKDMLSSK